MLGFEIGIGKGVKKLNGQTHPVLDFNIDLTIKVSEEPLDIASHLVSKIGDIS